jgi:hypothetical protein
MKRKCGDCQLCCKLVPVHDNRVELHKKAGEKCRHQKFGKGCMVYEKPEMPACCQMWNCRWIVSDLPVDMARPDRCHYVVDVMPDFVTLQIDDRKSNVRVVQIWCDPSYPHAHRDPALRGWLEQLSHQRIAGMVRYNEKDCLVIFPPAMSDDGKWHEVPGNPKSRQKQHSITDILEALGPKP